MDIRLLVIDVAGSPDFCFCLLEVEPFSGILFSACTVYNIAQIHTYNLNLRAVFNITCTNWLAAKEISLWIFVSQSKMRQRELRDNCSYQMFAKSLFEQSKENPNLEYLSWILNILSVHIFYLKKKTSQNKFYNTISEWWTKNLSPKTKHSLLHVK